jgi:nucleotide-binding universal stress UspA family protein
MAIKRILVPVDFSPPSLAALDYAVDLGRTLNAELTILFVVEPLSSAIPPGDIYASRVDVLLLEQQRSGREELAKIVESLQKKGAQCSQRLETGPVYRCINETAEKLEADLIVIGTHGRTGISHLLLGSVAERVVQLAPCPVLTVRTKPSASAKKAKRK